MITKANSLVARLACKLLPRWLPIGVEACRVEQDTTSFVRIGLPWVGNFFDWSIRPAGKYFSLQLFAERDARTQRVKFARVSGYRWALGMFIGQTNCVGDNVCSRGGFEVFTSSIHFGYTGRSEWKVKWHGSMIDPRSTYTLRAWRFGIGSRTDKWLKRIIEARQQRRLDAEMRAQGLDPNCTHPNMVDDSYGGPESGCMAGHCPRCGFSFHHPLY